MRKVTKGNVTIKLWDLGGQPRFRSMWERYCRAVSAIVYGYNFLFSSDFEDSSVHVCVCVCFLRGALVHAYTDTDTNADLIDKFFICSNEYL